MKPKRIILGLLYVSIIIGGVAPVQNIHASHAVKTVQNQNEIEVVRLQLADVQISDGTITALKSETVAKKLVAGAALIIPESMATKIGDHTFYKARIEQLAAQEGPGISKISAPGIKEVGINAFIGNQISEVDLPITEKIGIQSFKDCQINRIHLPEVKNVGIGAFLNNKIQSVELPELMNIGDGAFQKNEIQTLELPKVTTINRTAFAINKLTSVFLPNVETIGYQTFSENHIQAVNLPTAKTIEQRAFSNNQIISVDLPQDISIYDDAFSNQFRHQSPNKSEAFNSDPLSFQEILASQKISFKIGAVEQLIPDKISIAGSEILVNHEEQTISNPKQQNPITLQISASDIGYNIHSQIALTEKPSIKPPVTPPTTNPGGNTNKDPIGTMPPTVTPTDSPNPEKPINGSPTTEDSPTVTPNYVDKKGTAVFALKEIHMYKHAEFNKGQRIASYPKQKRVNRPMFVVTDYARSNGGALRYKVKDVNHHSKTAGKTGYITANNKYVVRVYYQSVPKSKKITVISKKGIHAYKNESLTGRTKTYKKGTRLTVKKLVKHNLTTRYQLSNGYFVTANKKLVIQGNY